MKKSIQFIFLAFVVLTILLSGCAPASTPVPPTFTPSPIPPTITPNPTFTSEPTSTATLIPSPTAEPIRDYHNNVCMSTEPECIVEKRVAKEDLVSIARYLQTLDWPAYDPDKVKIYPMEVNMLGDLVYEIATAPHYKRVETRPFRKLAFAFTDYVNEEGETVDVLVQFVQFYVSGMDPHEYPIVIGASPYLRSDNFKPFHEHAYLVKTTDFLVNLTIAPTIDLSGKTPYPFATGTENDINRFKEGDVMALNFKVVTFGGTGGGSIQIEYQ